MRLSDDRRWFIVDDELSLPVRQSQIEDHEMYSAADAETYGLHSVDRIHRRRRALCWVGSYQFSIIWGSATYSSNYPLLHVRADDRADFVEEPTNVEVMIFEPSGEPFDPDPIGHVDAEQLRALVDGFTATLSDAELHELTRRDRP